MSQGQKLAAGVILLILLGAAAFAWFVADVGCRKGYVTADGSCAWE